MIYVIGITGKKRVGKDTVAEQLKKDIRLPDDIKEIRVESIAKDLKLSVCKMLGISLEELEESKVKESITYPFKGSRYSMRKILQLHADDLKEIYGENIFIENLKDRLEESILYIIPDIRFDNEYITLAIDFKLTLVRLYNDHSDESDQHRSENGIDFKLVKDLSIKNILYYHEYENSHRDGLKRVEEISSDIVKHMDNILKKV